MENSRSVRTVLLSVDNIKTQDDLTRQSGGAEHDGKIIQLKPAG